MVRIVVRGPVASVAHSFAEEIIRQLKVHADRHVVAGGPPAKDGQASRLPPGPLVRILGPATAPMAKLRGSFRYQIQLQSADNDHLRSVVREATQDLKPPEGVVWTVDVDPVDMM